MNDLEALFDAVSIETLKEDLKEYGIIAAAAIGANVAFNYAVDFVFSKWTTAPAWAFKYGVPAAAIIGGLVAGRAVSNYSRKAGMGVSIGLVAAGFSMVAKQFAPNVKGLSGTEDTLLLGVSGLRGLAGTRRALAGATMTAEVLSGQPMQAVAGIDQVAATFN